MMNDRSLASELPDGSSVGPAEASPSSAKAKTAQEAAMEFVLEGLRTGRYRAGDQVVPEYVATEVGISHVPVREAVRTLEGRGTLTHVPRKGYFVSKLDTEDLDALGTLGELLETEALHRALPAITPDQIERMHDAITAGRSHVGRDPIGVATACRDFHNVMLERGVPKLLSRHLSMMWSTMEPYRPVLYASQVNQESCCDEHAAILEAIERRDVGEAVRAYDQHRANILLAVRQQVWFSDLDGA